MRLCHLLLYFQDQNENEKDKNPVGKLSFELLQSRNFLV